MPDPRKERGYLYLIGIVVAWVLIAACFLVSVFILGAAALIFENIDAENFNILALLLLMVTPWILSILALAFSVEAVRAYRRRNRARTRRNLMFTNACFTPFALLFLFGFINALKNS